MSARYDGAMRRMTRPQPTDKLHIYVTLLPIDCTTEWLRRSYRRRQTSHTHTHTRTRSHVMKIHRSSAADATVSAEGFVML